MWSQNPRQVGGGGGADFTVTETVPVTRIVPQDLKIRLLRLRTVFTAVISVSASLFFFLFFFSNDTCAKVTVSSPSPKIGGTHTDRRVTLRRTSMHVRTRVPHGPPVPPPRWGERYALEKEARRGENTNNTDNCLTAATYTKSE